MEINVPFLHREAIAVTYGPDAVHAAGLRCFRGAVKPFLSDHEPLENDEGDALARLCARNGLAGRVVVSVLPSRFTRFMEFDVPEFDDDGEEREWIENEIQRRAGVPRENLVMRFTWLAGGEKRRVLAACARRETVQAHAARLQAAGVIPGGIYLEASIAGHAHVSEEEFTGGTAWFLANGTIPFLSRYENGALTDIVELDRQDPDLETVLIEMRGLDARAEPTVLYVAGNVPHAYADEHGQGVEIRAQDYDGTVVTAAAMTALFGGLSRIDFLDHHAARSAREARERRDAIRLMRPLGIGTLIILIVLFAAEMVVHDRLDAVRLDMQALQPLHEAVSTEEAAIAELEGLKHRLESTLVSRTRLATVLEHVGAGLPSGIQATTLSLERNGTAGYDEQWRIRLAGESLEPQALTVLLARLETDQVSMNPRLRYARGTGDEAGSRSNAVSFEIEYLAFPLHVTAFAEAGPEGAPEAPIDGGHF